jgi:hypothetical protein
MTDSLSLSLRQGISGINAGDNQGSAAQRPRINVEDVQENKISQDLEADAVSNKISQSVEAEEPNPNLAQKGLALNAARFVAITSEAVSVIEKLRGKQLELAEEAEASDDYRRGQLEDEANNIQAEIERVASVASFNGRNAFTAGESSVVTLSEEQGSVVVLADLSSISADPAISFSSVEDAESAVTELEQSLQSTGVAFGQLVGAFNKSSSFISSNSFAVSESDISDSSATQLREAEALAQKISSDIKELAKDPEVEGRREALISISADKLAAEKVKELLS